MTEARTGVEIATALLMARITNSDRMYLEECLRLLLHRRESDNILDLGTAVFSNSLEVWNLPGEVLDDLHST